MKILIVSLDNLGDSVMAVGFADALKKAVPSAKISLWVKEYAKDLLAFTNFPNVFSSEPFWDTSPGGKKGTFGKFVNACRKIKKQKFDCVFILHTDWRKAFLCRLLGIKQIYGFNQKRSRMFLTKSIAPMQKGEHLLSSYKRLGGLLTKNFSEIKCSLKTLKTKEKSNDIKIGLAPFSGDDKKNWPALNWRKLAEKLLKQNKDTFIWIVSAKHECEKAKEIFTGVDDKRILFSCDAVENLKDTITLISSMDIFVGNDSGPLHLSCAFGVKSVGLFLEDKKAGFAPIGVSTPYVLSADTMDEIPLDVVLDTVNDV